MPTPYYLNPKRTKLPAGHDDTLDPSEAPTDAAVRVLAASTWPVRDTSPGPRGPRDRPAGSPPTDPARRSLPPFHWPRFTDLVGLPEPDLDPDIALWPEVIVNRWPFVGPPTTGVWPKGWFGIDTDAVAWICTAGGQPGTWIPFGGTQGQGFVTPNDFGAVGDGVTDDTHAVQTAFSSSNQVYLPDNYAVSAPIMPRATTGYYGGIIQGAGRNSGLIFTNTGTQSTCELVNEDIALRMPNGYVIRDLTLQGPQNVNPGQNNQVFISGLEVPIDGLVDNVLVQGFHSGLVFKGANHTLLRRVRSNNNFYGAIWTDYSGGVGNITMSMCHWDANALAGWKFGQMQYLSGSEVIDCDWSNNPWGILFTDTFSGWDGNNNPQYAGVPPTQSCLRAVEFRNIDAEVMGNGFFLDMSRFTVPTGGGGRGANASVAACSFDLVGLSRSGGTQWNKAPVPAAYQNQNWWFIAGFTTSLVDLRSALTFGTPNFQPTTTNAWMSLIFTNAQWNFWSGDPAFSPAILFTANADGVTWPATWAASLPPSQSPALVSADGNRRAILTFAQSAVTAGQLLQYYSSNTNQNVPASDATRATTGVALTTAAAGTPVFVAKQGRIGDTTALVTAATTVFNGSLLTFVAATPTQVSAVTTAGSALQIIGVGRSQVSAGNACSIDLYPVAN